jgi:hypothetical protein
MLFERPINVLAIEFWNYTKTPDRGVKDIHIYMDNNLVYQVDKLRKIKHPGLPQFCRSDHSLLREDVVRAPLQGH